MEANKIYKGNCVDLIDKLELNPNLIIMSPPDLAETDFSLTEYKEFLNIVYNKHMEKLHKNGVLVSITTDRKMNGQIYTKHIDIINSLSSYMLFNYKIWCKSMKANLFILNYCHMLFFRKNKKIVNNRFKPFYSDVLHIPLDKVKGYKSKDSFPTALIDILVRNFTNEGDLVLDPFVGSGKTACVAKDLGRNFIGFEIDEKYIEIAEERLG